LASLNECERLVVVDEAELRTSVSQQQSPISAEAISQLAERTFRGAVYLGQVLLVATITGDKRLYPDDLTTPIARTPIKLFANCEEELKRRLQEGEDQICRAVSVHKLSRLYNELNCSMLDFVLHLAAKAYVGFNIVEGGKKKRSGQPKWTGAHGRQLVAEVAAIKQRHVIETGKPLSTTEAIKEVLKLKGIKDRNLNKEFAKTKPRYYDALRSLNRSPSARRLAACATRNSHSTRGDPRGDPPPGRK
jgi:hypothetical protein